MLHHQASKLNFPESRLTDMAGIQKVLGPLLIKRIQALLKNDYRPIPRKAYAQPSQPAEPNPTADAPRSASPLPVLATGTTPTGSGSLHKHSSTQPEGISAPSWSDETESDTSFDLHAVLRHVLQTKHALEEKLQQEQQCDRTLGHIKDNLAVPCAGLLPSPTSSCPVHPSMAHSSSVQGDGGWQQQADGMAGALLPTCEPMTDEVMLLLHSLQQQLAS
jgi:hypothetical protein